MILTFGFLVLIAAAKPDGSKEPATTTASGADATENTVSTAVSIDAWFGA